MTEKKAHDFLADAVPAGDIKQDIRLKVLLGGANGAGKTMCAARFKKPLIVTTEPQGVAAIQEANPKASLWRNAKGEIGCRTSEDLKAVRATLRDPRLPEMFDAVVIDSLTDMQRIIVAAYTDQDGTVTQQRWGKIKEMTQRFCRELRDVPVHVAVTLIMSEVDDEGRTLHRPALSGSAKDQIGQFFNLVGFVHTRETEGGIRHQVLFRASDKYLTKGMTALDDVEPPEPLWWVHKRLGDKLPADVSKRVKEWQGMDSATQEEENNEGGDAPFAE